jgi:hypothetical protein
MCYHAALLPPPPSPQVCPANWQEGAATVKPNPKESQVSRQMQKAPLRWEAAGSGTAPVIAALAAFGEAGVSQFPGAFPVVPRMLSAATCACCAAPRCARVLQEYFKQQ